MNNCPMGGIYINSIRTSDEYSSMRVGIIISPRDHARREAS